MGEKFSQDNMHSMLVYRMGWNVYTPKNPFREIRCHRLDNDRAVIFILADNTAFLLYDELPLFPSDALVTKIRMMSE